MTVRARSQRDPLENALERLIEHVVAHEAA